MFPQFPFLDEPDDRFRNSVIESDQALRASVSKNGSSFVVSQFCIRVFLSMRVSTFLNFVGYVVERRTKEQVIWLNACRAVAFMKATHSFWNWTICKFPCCAVRFRVCLSKLNNAVAATIGCSGPNSASSWRQKIAAYTKNKSNINIGMNVHGTLTEVIDGSRVSPAVTGRRLQSLVPAITG